jgi:hypothetical protein
MWSRRYRALLARSFRGGQFPNPSLCTELTFNLCETEILMAGMLVLGRWCWFWVQWRVLGTRTITPTQMRIVCLRRLMRTSSWLSDGDKAWELEKLRTAGLTSDIGYIKYRLFMLKFVGQRRFFMTMKFHIPVDLEHFAKHCFLQIPPMPIPANKKYECPTRYYQIYHSLPPW